MAASDTETDGIVASLEQMGRSLEAWGYFPRLPRSERNRHLRYAPFLTELARRREFCRKLAAVDVSADFPPDEMQHRLRPLLEEYQFPRKPPYYVLEHWVLLLAAARLGIEDAVPNFNGRLDALIGKPLEVQFVYRPFGLQGLDDDQREQIPIVQALQLQPYGGRALAAIRDELRKACRKPLALFRERVIEIVMARPLGSFKVRLLETIAETEELAATAYEINALRSNRAIIKYRESVLTTFTVSFHTKHPDEALGEVVNGLLSALDDIVDSPSGRRPYHQDDASWWAMKVFDGLTVKEIAMREADDDLLRMGLEDAIKISFRRMGVPLRTK